MFDRGDVHIIRPSPGPDRVFSCRGWPLKHELQQQPWSVGHTTLPETWTKIVLRRRQPRKRRLCMRSVSLSFWGVERAA